MVYNAIISASFKGLLDMLDARKHVTVFEAIPDGKQVIIFDSTPVYHLLDIAEELKFNRYQVLAINAGLIPAILIKKEA